MSHACGLSYMTAIFDQWRDAARLVSRLFGVSTAGVESFVYSMSLLWGDRDAVIPIEQGRAFAALLEGAVFRTFEGCGHYLHNERPEEFVRAVREFLDDPAAQATRLIRPVTAPAGSLALREAPYRARDGRANPQPRASDAGDDKEAPVRERKVESGSA
jgi:hypothetical protein